MMHYMDGHTGGQKMITRSKQVWEVGETVKVGFLTLRVLAKVATHGDYKPDLYALTNQDGSRFYRFVPHNGIERVSSLQEAMEY
jgi:hypothetical protein